MKAATFISDNALDCGMLGEHFPVFTYFIIPGDPGFKDSINITLIALNVMGQVLNVTARFREFPHVIETFENEIRDFWAKKLECDFDEGA